MTGALRQCDGIAGRGGRGRRHGPSSGERPLRQQPPRLGDRVEVGLTVLAQRVAQLIELWLFAQEHQEQHVQVHLSTWDATPFAWFSRSREPTTRNIGRGGTTFRIAAECGTVPALVAWPGWGTRLAHPARRPCTVDLRWDRAHVTPAPDHRRARQAARARGVVA